MKKAQIWDPYADFQKTVLSNGLSIYSTYWERSWMQVRFCVNVGAVDDPVGKNGLAHFVEHMLAPNLEKNRRSIKRAGGNAAFGNTSLYYSDFHFDVPVKEKAISRALNIFGKILGEVPKGTFLEKERAIILQEFYRKYPCKNIHKINHMQFDEAFRGTPLEGFLGVLGTPETIKSITIKDIEDFFLKYYNFSNMNIIVAGGIKHDDVVEYIKNSIFSTGDVGESRGIPKSILSVPFPENRETVLSLSEVFPGLVSDVSSFCAWSIAPSCFSKKMISMFTTIMKDVLTHEIRGKIGGTYDVSVEYEFIGGCYQISIGIMFDPSNLKLVKEIVFSNILKGLTDKKVFERKKRDLINYYYISDFTMNKFCEDAQNDLIRYGRIISIREEIDTLKDLSFGECRLLFDYFSDAKRWWSLIQIP